jgi:hypothetical protein
MSEMQTIAPQKLKRARGSMLRAIRAGLIEAPPGYMTQKDMEREDQQREEKRGRAEMEAAR